MIAGDDLELFERSLRSATSARTGPELDASLEELGWRDALSVDIRVAVSLLFQLQGEANVTSSGLDQLLADAIGQRAPVLLPAVGRWDPPGRLMDGRLTVDGIGTASLASADTTIVVATRGDDTVALEVQTDSLPLRAVEGVDPSLGLAQVAGEVTGANEIGPIEWPIALALGQLALGHELVGASRQMLELARQHALDRVQFGQPIARFQAVRHRLAETLVAIEAADALLDAAWTRPDSESAAMAKAMAGRSARTAARHCQQVLAGIGFTTEHPLHRYVRRVLILEQLLGSTRRLSSRLGTVALDTQALPALVPL